MIPDLGERAGCIFAAIHASDLWLHRNPTRADRARFADADHRWSLFFQARRADIRGMRDAMERHQAKLCPICHRPSFERYRPFCSSRCADIDLGRWLSGGYAIATDEGDKPDESQDN